MGCTLLKNFQMPDGQWRREGEPVIMVSEQSAKLLLPQEKALESLADHSQIAKLKKTESGVYGDVKAAILDVVSQSNRTTRAIAAPEASFDRLDEAAGLLHRPNRAHIPVRIDGISQQSSTASGPVMAGSLLQDQLFSAIRMGKVKEVVELLAAVGRLGCSLQSEYVSNDNPLSPPAVAYEEGQILELLLRQKAELREIDIGFDADSLHFCAHKRASGISTSNSFVSLLVKNGVPIDGLDLNGDTPLIYCADYNNIE